MMQFFGWFLTRETVYLEKLKKAKKDTIYMFYTAKKEIKFAKNYIVINLEEHFASIKL